VVVPSFAVIVKSINGLSPDGNNLNPILGDNSISVASSATIGAHIAILLYDLFLIITFNIHKYIPLI
jgi:hypothetical protein